MVTEASLLSIGGMRPLEIAVMLILVVSFAGVLYLISSDWSLIRWNLLAKDTSIEDRIMTYLVLGITSSLILAYSFTARRLLLGIIAVSVFLLAYYYFREEEEDIED
jgi:hypothetical protein